MELIENECLIDFGLNDFVFKRMTFTSQDFARFLISKFGALHVPVNYVAVLNGLCSALAAFEDYCGQMNEEFSSFSLRVNAARDEVKRIYQEFSLVQTSLLLKAAELRNWQILETLDSQNITDENLKFAGAYFCLLLNDQKLNKQMINVVYRLISHGKEVLGNKLQRDLARMLDRASDAYSNREQSYIQKLQGFYFYKNVYASTKTRQSVMDWKAMTASEFIHASHLVHKLVLSGDHLAAAVCIALLTGLPMHLLGPMPLMNERLDEWLVALDLERGLILFDIDCIFPNRAKPSGQVDIYERSGAIVTKPLPEFLTKILIEFSLSNSTAHTLGELVKFDANEAIGFDIPRYINSVARFAVFSCQIDPFDAAIVASDFRATQNSKGYYRKTSRQAIWGSTERLYRKIGWGTPIAFVDGLSVGSSVVVKDDVVSSVFANLAATVESNRPPSRAKVEALLIFHDQFCAFTATFALFCLALRNANPIRINSDDFDENHQYLMLDDKHVLGDASLQPVAITHSLMQQLIFWRIHCRAMHSRLLSLGYGDKKFLKALEGVYLEKSSPLFVFSIAPYSASVAVISKFWSFPLVENFARHFWESKFLSAGVSSRFSAAQLRHQSIGTLSWGGESDFVLCNFIKEISRAQEGVLSELKTKPVHGVARVVR